MMISVVSQLLGSFLSCLSPHLHEEDVPPSPTTPTLLLLVALWTDLWPEGAQRDVSKLERRREERKREEEVKKQEGGSEATIWCRD